MKIKIFESFKKITKADLSKRYKDLSKTIYIPVYLSDDGDIVSLNPEKTAEDAWDSINHSLVVDALVVKTTIKGTDFFDE